MPWCWQGTAAHDARDQLMPLSLGELDLAVAQILDAADREIAALAPHCEACGKCCHFEDGARVLFASALEVEFLARRAKPVKLRKRNVCPYLQGQKCTVRDARPLGCRTFFCKDLDAQRLHAVYEDGLCRLAALSRRLGFEWSYGPMVDRLFERASAVG